MAGIKSEVTTIHSSLSDLKPCITNVEGKISSLEDRVESLSTGDLETTIVEIHERTCHFCAQLGGILIK